MLSHQLKISTSEYSHIVGKNEDTNNFTNNNDNNNDNDNSNGSNKEEDDISKTMMTMVTVATAVVMREQQR
jgi:hypothetical protein